MFDKFLNFSKYSMVMPKMAAAAVGAGSAVAEVALVPGDVFSQNTERRKLEITEVWQGPIIILSDESQMELERHYLSYNSTIAAESFEAIFRGKNLED